MALDLNKIDLSEFEEESEQLDSTMAEAVKVDPNKHAHISNLSKQSGVPEFAVEANPAEVEQKLKLDQIDVQGLKERSPQTSKFLSENFNNAVIAQEDVATGVLESIEETFRGLGRVISLDFKKQARGVNLKALSETPDRRDQLISPAALPIGIADLAPQLSMQIAENAGIESDEQLQELTQKGAEQLITEVQAIMAEQDELTPDDLNLMQQGVRSAFQSIAVNAPGMTLAVLTQGRTLPLAAIGSQVYAGSFAEGRAEGLSETEANWFALVASAIEVGTEVIPLGTLERMLTGKKSGLTKEALKFAIQEMGTEQLATLGETINQFAFGLDDQMIQAWEDRDFQQMAQIQLQRQAVTAIATVVHGGAQASAAAAINKTMQKLSQSEQTRDTRDEIEQNAIDNLNDQAEKSKLKERDVETFKQFVRESDGENDTHVFIDSVQASLYLQSKTVDEIETDPALKTIDRALRQSESADIAIPVDDFTGDIAGSEHFQQLREHMTMSEDGVTPFRKEQHREETQQYVETLLGQAEENVSEYVEAQEIFTQVRDQLVDSGAVNSQNASIMAQVVPAWATAQARRTGSTVADVYQRAGLTIEGPQTGVQDQLNAAALSQPPVAREQDFGDIEITEEFEVEETGELVTTSEPAQRRFDQTIKRRDTVVKLKDCLNAA